MNTKIKFIAVAALTIGTMTGQAANQDLALLEGISTEGAAYEVKREKENPKPAFRSKGDKLFLNFLNSNKGEVKIKVYDSSDRVLFKQVFENDLVVEKVFNFENAYEGAYTIAVNYGNKTFYKEVNVN